MSKPRKKPKKPRSRETVFALEGNIMAYPGSMLELHAELDQEQWKEALTDTCGYALFVRCLKDVAFPLLDEGWTSEDEFALQQLELSVSRMRNIDPLLVASLKLGELKDKYIAKMKEGAESVNAMIQEYRKAIKGDDPPGPIEVTVDGL